jgi:hypothetical protein
MIQRGKIFLMAISLALAATLVARAATSAVPPFQQVYDLIRTNSAIGEADLNRAAVNGLLKELGPKAMLITNPAASTETTPLVSKTRVFDGQIAYLRVSRVADGLANDLRTAYQKLSASNKLKGAVLDLRFADGTDSAAAISAAEIFPLKKTVAVDWGKGAQEAKSDSSLISVPLVVLVNGETAGASETLAAIIREANAGLILGNSTAGRATLTKDFPLSTGATLQVATTPIKVGGEELTAIHPDIAVAISAETERSYYTNGFFTLPKITDIAAAATNGAATNILARRPRLNEAELVRAHKRGIDLESELPLLESAPLEKTNEPPIVTDPALARALDLLKGLAIVRQNQP